jgi:transcriptional regulator with XRE-family HTH domain
LSNLQNGRAEGGRPVQPTELVPRQPATVLGWTMRNFREMAGFTETRAAREFGCSVSHISRVEHGTAKPSRALVQFYDDLFEADGLLLSLFESVSHARELARRRAGGRRPARVRAMAGDATAFVDETIPNGTLMSLGLVFVKTWRIRNVGTVPWHARRLERQGPITGPGLITSLRHVPVPDTEPGDVAEIQAILRAPGYDCSSIGYFKMVNEDGFLCFPDEHQLGLDVLVTVRRNSTGSQ